MESSDGSPWMIPRSACGVSATSGAKSLFTRTQPSPNTAGRPKGKLIHSVRCATPLLLLTTLALFLRIWGLDAGLTGKTTLGDEEQVVVRALRFGWGDLNPHWFLYPSLFMYIVFIFFGGFFAAGWAFGFFDSAKEFGLSFFAHPEMFYLIARTLSTLFGTGTIFLTYDITRRLTQNNLIALTSALFLAVSLFHIRESQSAKPDSAMIFFMMFSFYYTVKFWEDRRLRNAILAGATAGISISIKYPAGLILFPLLYVVFQHTIWSWSKRLMVSGLCVSIAVIAFIAGTPFAVLDFSTFVKWMWWVKAHADLVWRGAEYHAHGTFSIYLFHLWPESNGYVLALLALAGIVVFSSKRNSEALILGLFPLTYLLFMGHSTHVMSSFFTPFTPFLALYAALGVDTICSHTGQWKKPFTVLCAAIAITQPLFSIVKWQYYRTAPNTMSVAETWIKKNIPDGARLLAVNATPDINFSRELLIETLNQPLHDSTVPKATGSSYTGKGMYYEYMLNNIRSPSYYVRRIPSTVLRKTEDFESVLDQLKLNRYPGFQYIIVASLTPTGSDSVGRVSPVVIVGSMITRRDDVINAYHSFLSEIVRSSERLFFVTNFNSPPMSSDPLFFRLFFHRWGRPGNPVEIFQMPLSIRENFR